METNSKYYFPPKTNSVYIYKGFNNNFLNFKRYIDFFTEDKIQIRFDNGIGNIVNVYEYTNSGITLSYCNENSFYHQNFINEQKNLNDYLIKEPILQNTKWTLSDGSERCITNTNVQIKNQYYLFNSAIEVVTKFRNSSDFSIDYYVKNIGLVKTVYCFKKFGVFYFELEEILENSPYSKDINIYYPDKNLNTIWFVNKNIKFNTNEDINLILSHEFENSPNGLIPLITNNTLINKCYYDYINSLVCIDFSRDILKYLSSNVININLFLNCIYYTLKDYYKADNIFISIDNNSLDKYFNILTLYKEISPIQWRVSDCKYPFTYCIKDNDTLLNISRKFDINYIKLAKLNNIKNPNILSNNKVLQMYSSGIYKVKENDSLSDISDMFGVSIKDLIKFNNLFDSTTIFQGQKIKLCQ